MATVADLTAAVQAVSDGLSALGTSLTAEIAKLDAEIQAAGSGGIDPATLDPIVANLTAIAATVSTLKSQADNAT